MAETIEINRNTRRVPFGKGMHLRAPGLRARLTWRAPEEHAALMPTGVAPSADPVERALAEAGLQDEGSLNIDEEQPSADGGPADKIVVGTTIAPGRVQFAIHRDPSGVLSLHRPLPVVPQAAIAPPGTTPATHHYVIPLRKAPATAANAPHTAMLGGIAGRVVRFVGRKVLGVVGDVVFEAAKLWENKYRAAQGFHGGANATQLLQDPPLPVADFGPLNGNPSLLFIHGTTSSTAGAFIGLLGFAAAAGNLYTEYGNRVIGFNHHTLTKSVPQNAVDFYAGLPAGNYQFDVISHSRGGLLARALKELPPDELAQLASAANAQPGVNVEIGKILLVGTPDVGTPLADPTDLPKAVSRLASIASSFSADVATVGLGAFFAIFGGIVEGGIGSLPGLEDMNPGNPFLTQLNGAAPNNADYYGIEADYQPSGGLAKAIENNGVDALFLGEQNDLIVPTLGVSTVNGQALPAGQVNDYPPPQDVYHLNYFRQQNTWDKICGFLI